MTIVNIYRSVIIITHAYELNKLRAICSVSLLIRSFPADIIKVLTRVKIREILLNTYRRTANPYDNVLVVLINRVLQKKSLMETEV